MNSKTTQAPALPCRPYPAISYRAVGSLPALAGAFRFSLPPSLRGGREASDEVQDAEILEFGITGRLSGGRLADTYSFGLFRLPSGQQIPACTTFAKGELLLEVARESCLSPGETRALALAVVAGHIRERARQVRRGQGRN